MFLAGALFATLSASAAPQADAAAIVTEAMRELAAERRGVTAFRLRYDYREYGPAHRKTLVEDSMHLRNEGALVKVRLLSRTSNGAAASRDELAKQQAELDKRLPDEDYRLPLTLDALNEYRFSYAQAPCDRCPQGSVAIAFVSRVRDDGHGDGTLEVEPASHHVLRLDFHPSVLPSRADSGAIVMRFGPVLPDLWDVVETTQHYTGHVLFMHGGADVDQVYSAYKRFATLSDGLTALAAAS
ncbi:MAG: hypothetical protein JO092_00005 [Candidatus Eremiobacteraeota bacterium]|nr:hypothetical protein [Candidatus Eremiobacteraeota bacterium]